MPTPEELNAALHAAEHIEWGEPWRRHAQVLAAAYRKQERMLRDQRDSHLDEMAEARRDERERIARALRSTAIRESRYDTPELEMWAAGMWQAVTFITHADDTEIEDAIKEARDG